MWRPGRGSGPLADRAAHVLAAGVALAVALEVAQGVLVAGRTADALDAVAGSLGACLGLAAWSALRRARREGRGVDR